MLDVQQCHAVIAGMLRAQRATVLKGELHLGPARVADGALRLRGRHAPALPDLRGAATCRSWRCPTRGRWRASSSDRVAAARASQIAGRLIAHIDHSWDRRASRTDRESAAGAAGARAREHRDRARAARRQGSSACRRTWLKPACPALNGAHHGAAAAAARSPRETDVLVVGGGPAGIGAALGAAEAGAARARRALRLPRRQRDRRAGHAADVLPHECAAARSAATSHCRCCPPTTGPGEPVVAGALRDAAGAPGRRGGAIAAERGHRLHRCRSTRSRSSSSRSSCSTRPACSSCSMPSPRRRSAARRRARGVVLRDQVRPARHRGA